MKDHFNPEGGLTIRDLRYSRGDFHLQVDLSLSKGSLNCLLGPSGCGKTTLLNLIAGFVPPQGGEILLGGRDLTLLPPHRRRVGVVFQDYALFPHLDVLHNVLYGIKRRFPSLPAPRQIARAREYLDLVRLSGWDKRSVESLSGGEKQRVALARALAPEPELLLLDEPLSALDAGLRVSLRREIARIQAETSLLALYVTHDQEEALSLSDELFLMNRGRILQGGRPEEVYRRPGSLFAASFLGGANFITGRLDQGEGTFLTDAGRRLGVCPSPGFVSGPGRLFFRPEDGRFCGLPENPEAGDFNYFKARLVKTEFLGAFRLFHLLTEEGPVILQAPAGEALPEGELWFKVPRLCCLGFSGQD